DYYCCSYRSGRILLF
nr:immunoglobulin light chain junction region [Macaca mulatta]